MKSRRMITATVLLGAICLVGVGSSAATTGDTADSAPGSASAARVVLRDESGLATRGDDAVGAQALGDDSTDLVFTPVTPCRLWDTRNTGVGAFTGAQTFGVSGNVNPTTQGGSLATCGLPVADPVAVVLNVTAISTSTFGWAHAYAANGSLPVASVLNWTAAGQIVPNTTVVPVCPGCGVAVDVSIYHAAAAYSFADVVGYFNPPGVAKLDRVVLTNIISVPNGGDNFVRTAYCETAGTNYTLTGGGGGFNLGSFSGWNYLARIGLSAPEFQNATSGGRWIVGSQNLTGATNNLMAMAICMRVPGI